MKKIKGDGLEELEEPKGLAPRLAAHWRAVCVDCYRM
jgi:hypothetical protein